MSNRVEELERKASELQAAVNGLTEELVETKERVRQLEEAVEVDDPAVRAKPRSEPEPEAETTADTTESDADAETESESEADDEPEQRFVDADAHEKTLENSVGPEGNTDEEAKSEEANEEETESESDGSDIIVA
ncbi:DUF7518 family protein [Salinigranum halophilum]|uniref:DUF7518 family protein n=1 Tax=Salinigranum halophilum TaxID=2565931 RepID=UPI00191C0BF4|nr:chromosome segregation protein SMC [Salinigranum halophilum]